MWVYEIGVAKYFSEDKKKNNAVEFYNFFSPKGLTLESICGMLGNIERESTLNPGIKQTTSTSSGWGLIQWTPSTDLTNWCKKYRYNWYDGTAQCIRINAEGEQTMDAGGVWIPTASYPYSWDEFKALTDVNEATKAYLYERERAGAEALDLRLEYANKWYEYLGGQPSPPEPPEPPEPPHPTPVEKRKFPWWMCLKKF